MTTPIPPSRLDHPAAARPREAWVFDLALAVLFLLLAGRVAETYLERGLFDYIGEDYAIYAATARVVQKQGFASFYDLDAIARETAAFTVHYGPLAGPLRPGPSPYPVAFLLPFLAADRLGDVGGFLFWTLLNAALLAAMTARPPDRSPRGRLLLAAVVFFPAAYNLILGQLAIAIAFGLDRALRALEDDRELAAGLWLGFLFIKPQFALTPLIVLVALGRWRVLLGLGSAGALLAGSTLALAGMAGVRQCLAILRSFSGFRDTPAVVDPWDMINIRGLLLGLPPGWLDETTGSIATAALSLAVIASLVLVWRGGWNVHSPLFPAQMLATMVVTLVTAYHNHVHGAALLIPPALMVLARGSGTAGLGRLIPLGVLLPTAVVAATGEVKAAAWTLVAIELAALGFVIAAAQEPRPPRAHTAASS